MIRSDDSFFMLSHEKKNTQDLIRMADAGDAEATLQLVKLSAAGDGSAKAYVEGVTKIVEMRKVAETGELEAVNALRSAAEAGNTFARSSLSDIYRKKGDVEGLRRMAELGDVGAQCSLGERYLYGEGVSKNTREAADWFRKAAENESPLGQYYLGSLYETGNGISMNEKEAVNWYVKAAEHGIENAELRLGFCYESGKGVPTNVVEAVKLYRRLSERGLEHRRIFRGHIQEVSLIAQNRLGVCYSNGLGVPQDFLEAYAWFKIASTHGQEDAAKNLANIEEHMTPVQIGEANRRTLEKLGEKEPAPSNENVSEKSGSDKIVFKLKRSRFTGMVASAIVLFFGLLGGRFHPDLIFYAMWTGVVSFGLWITARYLQSEIMKIVMGFNAVIWYFTTLGAIKAESSAFWDLVPLFFTFAATAYIVACVMEVLYARRLLTLGKMP